MKETTLLKKAIRTAYDNKKLFFLSIFLDILFFFVYGFATAPIYLKLMANVNIIGAHAGEAVKTATRDSQSMFSALSSEVIAPYFNNIIWLLLILAATTYLTYCIFQAVNWKIALQLTGKKIKYLDYLKKFLLLNILWFILFALYYALGLVVDIRKILISTLMQTQASNTLNVVLVFYLIFIAYFAVISYIKLNLRKSISTGTSKIKQLLPSILLIAVYLLALNIVIKLLASIHPLAGIIIGFILLLPAMTIARIYISLTIQKM
ncbi:hypothetical protein KY338_04440 [Candidatus Woesearchaeota archaeon]|nr:hypothetical protein [Candidatus Woesearchaeota archaeon]MBW3005770.1 hypothetical protein [Candidatus Woesearchaeota archaeon]